MTDEQLQELIRSIRGTGTGSITAGAAAVVGFLTTCVLGKDKIKRHKKWSDWHKDAQNNMRLLNMTDAVQKLNYLRRRRRGERSGKEGGPHL